MQQMMDFQFAKQRHGGLLREAEMNRQARALRATRRQGTGRRSALVWEVKRQSGRLLKFLRRTLRNAS